MAKVVFKSYNQNDNLLFPPCLGDFIAENDPVKVLNAVVDNLDLSAIESSYEGGGASSYNPRMLTKVVFYAYLQNVYSGRKMETLLKRDVNFMWLSGMQTPDFNTINLFRKNRLAAVVDDLFTQLVRMLVDQKIISLEVQYVDGTKIEANANKYTFVWKKATQTNREKLDRKVKAILAEAEKELGIELGEGEQDVMTPAEMTERTDRILDEMDNRGISDKRLRKSVSEVKDVHAKKMSEYDEKLEILGERNSCSKTDPDATFMRMKEDAMNNGQTKPGYNVQISTERQFITNYDIFWRPTDQGTLIPFLTSFSGRYGMQSDEVCADSGYGSEQNYAHMFGLGIVPYVKYNMFHAEEHRKYKNNPFLTQNMYYNIEENYYVCPMGQHLDHIGDMKSKSELGYESTVSKYMARNCTRCPLRGMCYKGQADARTIEVNHQANAYKAEAKRLLTSERGVHHRSNRPIEPEAVFGDIKQNHGFKRFKLKSNRKVKVEFGLVATAHNLRKYIALERMRSNAVSSCL